MNKINYKLCDMIMAKSRINTFLLILIIPLFFLAACGSSPPVKTRSYQKESIELNNQGERAYEKEKYDQAFRLFSKALNLSRSVEYTDGIESNSVNVIAALKKLKRHDEAIGYVDMILNSEGISYSSGLMAEANYLKGLLLMDLNRLDDAKPFINEGLSLCEQDKCGSGGKLSNLMARLLIMEENYEAAMIRANEGLSYSRKNKDERERANSFRLMGDASIRKKAYKEASDFYNDALPIDKELGLSEKISEDLVGLGNTNFHQNLYRQALKYYSRALNVAEGRGDEEASKKIVKLILECKKNMEDTTMQ